LQKNAVNNVVFVAKVIIQVARTDPQVSRDMVGGHIRLSLFVKQLQSRGDDFILGFHPADQNALT
jgi:hypothetical protein